MDTFFEHSQRGSRRTIDFLNLVRCGNLFEHSESIAAKWFTLVLARLMFLQRGLAFAMLTVVFFTRGERMNIATNKMRTTLGPLQKLLNSSQAIPED